MLGSCIEQQPVQQLLLECCIEQQPAANARLQLRASSALHAVLLLLLLLLAAAAAAAAAAAGSDNVGLQACHAPAAQHFKQHASEFLSLTDNVFREVLMHIECI